MGLILDIQRDAMDPETAETTLVRKALVAARKLGLSEFETWCRSELNGYRGVEDLPTYRAVPAQLKAFNEYRGWIPAMVPDELADTVNVHHLRESLAELESILVRASPDSPLQVDLPSGMQQALSGMFQFEARYALKIQATSVAGVIGAVRDAVLNWSLDLEQQGVHGEGLSFTESERRAAAAVTSVVNIHGGVHNSQVMAASPGGHQAMSELERVAAFRSFAEFLATVKVDSIPLGPSERSELQAEMKTLIAQASSPTPRLAGMADTVGAIRRLVEGAAASVVGNEITQQLIMLGL